ncbi:hypothetical protein IC229_25535 [Spirosoma sp. BT702]|uniref:Uncharacterized protein n=1 Tax=Spirosoma profusum TaxID=2771354 RepID=A0A926XZX3_9BACT|nr:hypothetical protein [Spirosoma profusum]MBD2704033.1 hypothetical protein [Spirosoma profusum]
MDFAQQLDQERRRFLIQSNGGISLPAAGALYWLALGIAGFWLSPGRWMLVAFIASGLIFPLGLALQKPLKTSITTKSPLSSLIGPALIAMMLSWPVTIAASGVNKSLVPLALAIGMSLYWPVIGWLFNSRTCLIHAIGRTLLATALWYLFPNDRFTFIPLCVALLYGLAIWGLKREVAQARLGIV